MDRPPIILWLNLKVVLRILGLRRAAEGVRRWVGGSLGFDIAYLETALGGEVEGVQMQYITIISLYYKK